MRRTLLLLGLLSLGCGEQKMARQPRVDPYEGSALFPDGKGGRPLPHGTIARGQQRENPHFFQGRLTPNARARAVALFGVGRSPLALTATALAREGYADLFPMPVTPELLARGRQRFEIYCAVCHGRAGYGDGKIVERGYTKPPSYHIDRLRDAPVGYFFEVMTDGYGAMPSLSPEVPVADRWAIAAHMRLLQASQNVPVRELSPAQRERLPSRDRGNGND